MPSRLAVTLSTMALLAAGLVAAPAALAGDPCYHDFDLPARTEGTDAQVKLLPCAFAPTITRVPVGTTVEFLAGPDFVHLITGANQEWGDRDAEIQPGTSVSYKFEKAGIYPFACALHRGMSGVIVVGDGLASAAPAGLGAPAATTTADLGEAAAAAAATAGANAAAAASRTSPTEDLRPVVAVGAVLVAVVFGLLFAVRGRRTAA
jgi:plastocyanin